jgi:CBS domain-containing protein
VEKNIGISGEQDVLCMMCSFVVGSNVPFRCAAVLPDSLFPQPSAPDAGPQDTAGDAQIPEGASAAGQEPDKAPKDNPETTLLPQARPGRPCAATVMEKRVLWVSESDTVGSVLKQMAATASTYALVGSDGKADGIVSSHDLAAAISPYLKPMLSQWRRPQDEATLDIKIRWVMSKPVETVAPDTPVEWLAGRMVKTGIGCLPVAGTDGKIEGIVTRNDLLSLLEKGDVEQDGITAPAAYSHTN